MTVSALWGWFGLTDQFARTVLFTRLGALADLLAYGCWFAFLLKLLQPRTGEKPAAGLVWLNSVALAAVGFCLLLQLLVGLNLAGVDERSRPVLLGWMVLAVLALVLVEQLLRNLQDDSLWNAKPLCLGLAGAFLFDLYLFSSAVMFNTLDVDAASIRGAVHALMVPLLLLSVTRRKDWVSTLRVSRKVAFHSATLLIAGVYLIFISAVGYYVRFFGGEWGRALQLGLVFVALLLLGILALSGSVRAKLRVFVGKHFFRYRYDYREEWLRFTQTLSAQNSPQQMGQQVIRGLADMLESPAGGLWMKSPNDRAFRQTARWNLAQVDEPEDEASALCGFMVRTGWVINLEEYRSIPRRYESVVLPAWLLGLPQALADRAAVRGRRSDRFRGAGQRTHPGRRELGGQRPAQDGGPPGGQLPGADAGHRGAARGAQVRRLQPHVGLCRARPEEHRDAVVTDDEKRQALACQP